MKRSISIWVIAFCLSPSARAEDVDNPLKKAKVGDWARYSVAGLDTGQNVTRELKFSVTAMNDKEVTLTTTSYSEGKIKGTDEWKSDLSKPFDLMKEFIPMDTKPKIEIEKVERGKEKTKASGKEYECIRTKKTFGNETFPMLGECKIWTSERIPAGGIVKWELKSDLLFMNLKMELKEFGSK